MTRTVLQSNRIGIIVALLATLLNLTGCGLIPSDYSLRLAPIKLETKLDTGENLRALVDQSFANLDTALQVTGGETRKSIQDFMAQLEMYSYQVDKIAARRIADLDARTQTKMLEVQRFAEEMNRYAQGIVDQVGEETKQIVQATGEEARLTVDELSGQVQIVIGETGKEVRLSIDKASSELQVLTGQMGEETRLTIEKIVHGTQALLDAATRDALEVIQQIETSQRHLERDVEAGVARVINGVLFAVVIIFDRILAIGGAFVGLIFNFVAAYGWGRLTFRRPLPSSTLQRYLALGLLLVTFIVSLSPFSLLSGSLRNWILTTPLTGGANPVVEYTGIPSIPVAEPEIWRFNPDPISIDPTTQSLSLTAIGSHLTVWGEPQIIVGSIPLQLSAITEDKLVINLDSTVLTTAAADYVVVTFTHNGRPLVYKAAITMPTPTPLPTIEASPIMPTTGVTPETTIAPTPTPIASTVQLNQTANIRSGPGDYPVLGTEAAGQTFPLTGKHAQVNWYRIDYKGQEGWVYGSLVSATNTEQITIVDAPTLIAFPVTPTPAPTACPAPTLTAPFQSSVNADGTITLSWGKVENAESAYLNDGIGQQGISTPGELIVSPSSSTTYNLIAFYCGSQSIVLAERTLAIDAPPSAPVLPLPLPDANFDAAPQVGQAPLVVQFTDTSTNGPTDWLWRFGDGGTSRSPNPTYTYNTPGTYEVTLVASNAQGADTETKSAYLVVTAPPLVEVPPPIVSPPVMITGLRFTYWTGDEDKDNDDSHVGAEVLFQGLIVGSGPTESADDPWLVWKDESVHGYYDLPLSQPVPQDQVADICVIIWHRRNDGDPAWRFRVEIDAYLSNGAGPLRVMNYYDPEGYFNHRPGDSHWWSFDLRGNEGETLKTECLPLALR